jgi:hypothetical protein
MNKTQSQDPHYIIAFYKAIIEELTIKGRIDDLASGTEKATMEDFKTEFLTMRNENKMLTNQLKYLKDTLQLKEESKEQLNRLMTKIDYKEKSKYKETDSIFSERSSYKSPMKKPQGDFTTNAMLQFLVCQSMVIEEQLTMHAKKKSITYLFK